MTPAALALTQKTLNVFRPPPDYTVSQWADARRYLSPEASSEPGRWNTDRTPYLRGILDAVSDPLVEEVDVMSSAQIGKTEVLLNILGYHIDYDAAPILVVQPTLEMAEAFSKDRLAPMLRDTPAIQGKVKDARARDSGNTLLHKSYPGGQITMAGANSPSSLASRPKRVILMDEVDRYPASAGTEGDPVTLAKKRANTFHNRKFILTSTPTIKGISRIERSYEQSDKRKYWVPCPHCGGHQVLKWKQVTWPEKRPDLAHYVCELCDGVINDAHKIQMLKRGEWRAEGEFRGIAGFHLSELYSPWRKFGQVASDFAKAKGNKELLKAWTNTSLGETWEEQAGEKVEWQNLYARCEPYKPLTVPMSALVLSAGVDTQDNRLAVSIKAWAPGEESFLVWYGEIYGDPGQDKVWGELDEILFRTYEHESGTEMHITATAVDSGGHHTQAVYAYCRARADRNVIAIKGSSTPGTPVRGKQSNVDFDHRGKKIAKGATVWILGVDTAKAVIYNRMKLTENGPGKMHFYVGLDQEYFEQLTSEKRVTKLVKGVPRMEWIQTRPRNEALDCEVYAYAAAIHAGIQRVDWNKLKKRIIGEQEPERGLTTSKSVDNEDIKRYINEPAEPSKEQVRKPPIRRTSFATGWKNR